MAGYGLFDGGSFPGPRRSFGLGFGGKALTIGSEKSSLVFRFAKDAFWRRRCRNEI